MTKETGIGWFIQCQLEELKSIKMFLEANRSFLSKGFMLRLEFVTGKCMREAGDFHGCFKGCPIIYLFAWANLTCL